MKITSIIFLLLVLLHQQVSAEGQLGKPHEMWSVIEPLISAEHEEKIKNKDSSTYIYPDSGPLENSVLFGYQDLVEEFSSDDLILNEEGTVSLYLAASLGRVCAIRTLIRHGVDVDAKYQNGLTALYAAAEYGELEAFKLLLKKGADVNYKADVPFTILQLAIAEKRQKIVDHLLKAGYVVTNKDEKYLANFLKKGQKEGDK